MPSIEDIMQIAEELTSVSSRRRPSKEDAEESLARKVDDLHRLWVGDDVDARAARSTINFCESYIRDIVINQNEAPFFAPSVQGSGSADQDGDGCDGHPR